GLFLLLRDGKLSWPGTACFLTSENLPSIYFIIPTRNAGGSARGQYLHPRLPEREMRGTLPPKSPTVEIVTDPAESAKMAGLRYVTDTKPGFRRKRAGKGFYYIDAEGKRVRDAETLARIKSLVIPPAWTGVWICPNQ